MENTVYEPLNKKEDIMLKAPLSFQGGKQRVAKKLVEIIKGDVSNTQYIDFCCGSGAVSVEMVNQGVHPENITMVDKSDWGEFWSQVSSGSFDKDMFEDIIESIPKNPELIQQFLKNMSQQTFNLEDDVIPVWLCLQAGSFGGKHIWAHNGRFHNASFRNYWKPTPTSNRKSPVNPMMPMPDTLKRQVLRAVDAMSPVKAVRCDVLDFSLHEYERQRVKENVVIFIDPPYNGTTGYGFTLDYKTWMESLELPDNYSVFITDYKPHGHLWWELSNTSKGGISGGSKKRAEILSMVK